MWMDRLGWLAFALPFGFWLWMAGASPEGVDAPGVVAATFSLRETHPMGGPLALMLGHGFALLPLGSLSFRMTVASAFFLAVAAWLSFQAGVHLLVLLFGVEGRGVWGRWMVLCGVGVVMGSVAVCMQANHPGFVAVYVVLLCAAWERSLAWWLLPEPLRLSRGGGLAVLFFGLTLAMFPWPSVGYLCGGGLLCWGRRSRLRWGHACVGVGLLLVGFGSFLYLPVRASQGADSWLQTQAVLGPRSNNIPSVSIRKDRLVSSQTPFLDISLGETKRKEIPPKSWAFSQSVREVVGWFFSQAGGWFFVMGFVGLCVAWGRVRSVGVALWVWCMVGPWGAWMAGASVEEVSSQGLFIPSLLVLGWSVAIALFWLAQRWRRRVMAAAACVLLISGWGLHLFPCSSCERGIGRLLFPVASASQKGGCCRPRDTQTALLWSELMEELLPRDALVLTREAHHTVLLLYRQAIERQRPDVTYIPRDLRDAPHFVRARLLRSAPPVRLLRRLQERELLRLFDELRNIAEGRPVCLEWFEDLPEWIAQTAYPTGLLFTWDPENPVARDARGRAEDDERMAEQQRRFWQEAYALLGAAWQSNALLRERLQTTHILHAQAYLQSGRWRAAKQEIVYALRWQGHEQKLRVLQKRLQPHLDTLTPLPPRK